jgi:hypothetical protein
LRLSSPGSTGRSSNYRPGVLDCPVKPGNDTFMVAVIHLVDVIARCFSP